MTSSLIELFNSTKVRSALFFSFLFMGVSGLSYAQDKLILMSGTVVHCEVTKDDAVFVEYNTKKNNGTIKERMISRFDVFSIIYASGEEKVIYAPDPMDTDAPSEVQLRSTIQGSRDAYDNFQPKWTFWSGIGVGLAGGYLGKGSIFITTGTPLAWAGAQYIGKIRIREATMSNLDYQGDFDYANGYERVARSKKFLNALAGGAIGSGLGTLAYIIVENN